MGGTLYRPHVVNPSDLPPEFKNVVATNVPDEVHVPIDPQNWITITDAMAGVVQPGLGTAPSAHLEGIDFAGKTGSAQVVSNSFKRARGGGGKSMKDNGWFAGVAPRRNPEIVVCVLLEQGEHGYLAARVASQVIKAYVDKQRRLRNNPTLFSDKADPGAVPIAGVWNNPETPDSDGHTEDAEAADRLQGGTLRVKVGHMPLLKKTAKLRAIGVEGNF
jgi:penicillin-binding protein 2